MDTLANITKADVNNGTLNRLLADAGIPNVAQYVKNFHQETEALVVNKLEYSDQYETDGSHEQIIPPADIQNWVSGARPQFYEYNQPATYQEPQQQQLSPQNVQSWMKGLRSPSDQSQQPTTTQRQPPNLSEWLRDIVPGNSNFALDNTASETTTFSDDDHTVTGNLNTWLNDWSKSLGELPPPTSLDSWLQSLIPQNVTDSLDHKFTTKKQLNNYLNAAQEVLSKHGYTIANDTAPLTAVQPKSGMFGNVKHMYFLWKVLDKNNDRKITVEDVQIMLQEMGLGFLSKTIAQTLFEMVDSNHDGSLSFRDCVALMGIIKQLVGAVGAANKKA